MTNEELKSAIKFFNGVWNVEMLGFLPSLNIFFDAARELSQLKDGTHPDMVMVPRDVMLHARHYLDGVARDAYDSSEVCEIIYRIDKAMIAAAQKGTE